MPVRAALPSVVGAFAVEVAMDAAVIGVLESVAGSGGALSRTVEEVAAVCLLLRPGGCRRDGLR